MFFLHAVDMLMRPVFRDMIAIWIQHILDECSWADPNEIRGHNRGCFQLPDVVIRITLSFHLQYISNNRNAKDSDCFQSCLFVNIRKIIVQVTNPTYLILNVHNDQIFLMNQSFCVMMVSGSITFIVSMVTGRMYKPVAISTISFDTSCRCCEITMLRAWILVKVVTILSNNDEIAVAITHRILDGA